MRSVFIWKFVTSFKPSCCTLVKDQISSAIANFCFLI